MSDADPVDSRALFALVYKELRQIARSQRRAFGRAPTLVTTALVHEAYLKLHAAPQARSFERAHFLSLAARAMRQILVDHARSAGRLKRGGDVVFTVAGDELQGPGSVIDLVALDEALSRLAELDPRAGQLVEWRVFAGMELADIARLQKRTERTVFRDWRRARAFLARELDLPESGSA